MEASAFNSDGTGLASDLSQLCFTDSFINHVRMLHRVLLTDALILT